MLFRSKWETKEGSLHQFQGLGHLHLRKEGQRLLVSLLIHLYLFLLLSLLHGIHKQLSLHLFLSTLQVHCCLHYIPSHIQNQFHYLYEDRGRIKRTVSSQFVPPPVDMFWIQVAVEIGSPRLHGLIECWCSNFIAVLHMDGDMMIHL